MTLSTSGKYLDRNIEIPSAKSVTGTATIENSTTVPTGYTENTSVIVPSQGYLKINAGYIDNTVISLDQMLDGKTDTAGTAEGNLLTGKIAYDVDGKKLTGTMPNNARVGLSSEVGVTTNAQVGTDTYVYFRLAEGYYPNTAWRGTPLSTFGTATAAQVLKGKTFTSTSGLKVSGTIETVSPATTTDTNAATTLNSGTKLKIPAGYHASTTYYIAQSQNASSTTPSTTYYTTTDSGYGKWTKNTYSTSDQYIKAGAGAKDTASATITGGSGNETTPTTMSISETEPSSGNYYTITANGSGNSKITTAGWMPTGALASASTTKNYYVAKATSSKTDATASASVNKNPSASASATQSGLTDGTYQTTATSGYTYKISASASAASGTATASVTASSATVSAGYNPSSVTTSTSQKSATSTEQTASDSKDIYLIKGTITNNTSGGTSSGTINRGSQIKIGAGYYPSDVYYQAQGDAHSAGTITPNVTTLPNGATANTTKLNKNTYIKIGAGAYANDVYYQVKNYTEESHSTFTPNTTYFQTGTTGAVSTTPVIPANQYATAIHFLKKGTAGAISGGGVTGTRVTLSTSNTSGVSITRAAASYSISTAGWISAAGSGLSASTQYITGVTLAKPSSGYNTFAITVPSGSSTVTFTWKVDSSGNVYVV